MAEDLRQRYAEARDTLARVRAIAEKAAASVYTGGPGDSTLPPDAVLGRQILATLDGTGETEETEHGG